MSPQNTSLLTSFGVLVQATSWFMFLRVKCIILKDSLLFVNNEEAKCIGCFCICVQCFKYIENVSKIAIGFWVTISISYMIYCNYLCPASF
jgi:hypothetical protein